MLSFIYKMYIHLMILKTKHYTNMKLQGGNIETTANTLTLEIKSAALSLTSLFAANS